MKRPVIHILTLLLAAAWALADQPRATTAPANPLKGRWQLLSIGKKTLPENVSLFWTFDERNVVVTVANGDVATKSPYSLRTDGGRRIISITPDDKHEPDRVGCYEMTEGKLRIQLTLGTGKPPERWNEDEVMLFEPAPSK